MYDGHWSDVDSISTVIDTTWQTRDVDGDGDEDLIVREKHLYDRYQGEPGDPDEHDRKTRTTTCPYSSSSDRWVCPEWLGTELIDGGKLVERTSVPIPVPAPADEQAG